MFNVHQMHHQFGCFRMYYVYVTWAVSEIGGKDTEAIPEHVQLMKVYSTELPPVLDRISVSQLNFLFPLFLVLPALPFVFTICVSSLILSGMFNYQPWSCCSNAGIEP